MTESDKTVTINFDDTYTGRIGLVVKGKNNNGISESSDTLYINVLPVPTIPTASFRGRYCSNNPFGDSISLINPQPLYSFQLYKDGNPSGTPMPSVGSKISWYDLKAGTYSIMETLCTVSVATDMLIKEVEPTSAKPEIHSKWNDVLVCLNHADSIMSYQWYKDGLAMTGETSQFLWTQQKKGNYMVKTTDDSGCEFTSESMLIEPSSDGLIFPNPNHGDFKVSFTNSNRGNVVIRISNAFSLPVKTYTYQKDNDLFEQDISVPGLAAGVYFVDILMDNSRVFYEKIIVE
jgi:hypothetical protein